MLKIGDRIRELGWVVDDVDVLGVAFAGPELDHIALAPGEAELIAAKFGLEGQTIEGRITEVSCGDAEKRIPPSICVSAYRSLESWKGKTVRLEVLG